MNVRNVILIFRREVLDQLRDRRTLFMVAVLPMLLYPLLGIGTAQMTAMFTEQPRRVVILGAADLPSEPLIDGGRFSSKWFHSPTDADKLRVATDLNEVADKQSEIGNPSTAPSHDAATDRIVASAKKNSRATDRTTRDRNINCPFKKPQSIGGRHDIREET